MDSSVITTRVQNLEETFRLLRSAAFGRQSTVGPRGAERYVLRLIGSMEAGRPVTPSALASRLGVTVAAITHHVNALESQGYVQRISEPEDRRVVPVCLTAAGKALAATMEQDAQRRLRGMVEHLGEKDSAELLRLAGRITEYLEAGKENG